jgi:glyoxylase-like metal-dependent hydrolase (beta-lactamase superfamily II)
MKNILKRTTVALFTFSASIALASAPMQTGTPAAFYRIHVGAFEVTSLSDGTVDLPMAKLLTNITPAEYKKSLAKNATSDPFETSVNAFLVNTGTKLVLIDSGAGTLFGPTLGKVLSNLKAAGYQPEQVDVILISHLHPDHVGGLMVDKKIAFPNAVVYADKADTEFWLSDANLAKAPDANKDFFKGAMASLNSYQAAGKLKTITADGEIVPGINSKATHGHTAGHTNYIVESQGKKLVLIGDLMHVAAVQFDHPAVGIQFDSEAKTATANRKAAFQEAAKEGYLIGASHLPFPGLGHIRGDKSGYVYLPMTFTRQ